MDEEIAYNGIRPSGNLILGNYIGALRNSPPLQEDYDCIYHITDIHAITAPQEPKALRAHSLDILALYLAVGIDPGKSTICIQSHVPAHVELMRFLNIMTGLGQLQRMAQFKSKAEKASEINADLLNYPVLTTSGTLLYGTHYVPVGSDQKQHVGITKDLAGRFNSRYSETFVLPEMLKAKMGGRVMSPQDPTEKMSRSDVGENSFILILGQDDVIRRKFRWAVADSEGHIAYSDQQAGVENLLDIYSTCSSRTIEDLLENYDDKGYGALKEDVAEAVIGETGPVRDRFHEVYSDRAYSGEVYQQGAEEASRWTSKISRRVYKKMDSIPR